MTFRFQILTLLVCATALSGCESVGETLNVNRQPLTVQQQAALAVGTDYQTALYAISASGKKKGVSVPAPPPALDDEGNPIGSSSDTGLAPAPPGNSFGPRIGQYFLADDYVVYRHALPQAVVQAGPVIDAVTGEPVPLESDAAIAPTQVRLTYFLVSPKGTIEDYALGTLNVSTTACLQIIQNNVVICDEPDRLSEDFELFDSAVRTSKFAPLSSWVISATEEDVAAAPIAASAQ